MGEVKRFIKVKNHEAVKIGGLEKNSVAIRVVGPDFTAGGRGLARSLSSRLQSPCRRGSGMGEVVLQGRGHEQGSQRPPPECESQAKSCGK